jgi:glycosyltransferase involved in cell wall biosynthesis
MTRYVKETAEVGAFISRRLDVASGHGGAIADAPKISIIMPSYNQSKYIERSILSVLNQGYPNLEFIIVDGGSTDDSTDIIKRYSSDLAYWHSGPDKGQSDALNHGLSRVTGDIVGWLNSDDLYVPGAFAAAVEAFKQYRRAEVVFGDWWEIDGSDRVTDVAYAFDFSVRHFVYEGFHLNAQAMFIRQDALLSFGQFDVGLHRTMDYDMILRLGIAEGQAAFKRIKQPLACFRRHEEQKTQGFDPIVEQEHRRIALKNGFESKFSYKGKLLRPIYRMRRAYWYVLRGGGRYALARARGLPTN